MTTVRKKIHGWDALGYELVTLMQSKDYDRNAAIALIMQGADTNVQRDCLTPLIYACDAGDAPMVKLLLEHNADVTIAHSSGTTPLIYNALNGGSAAVAALLVAYKAPLEKTDPWSATALDNAISNGFTDVALVLIDAGANVNTHAYHPALGRAAATENFILVDALIQHGAKVTMDIIDRFADENPQMRAKMEYAFRQQSVVLPTGTTLGKKIILRPKSP